MPGVSTERGLLRAPPSSCDLSLSAWPGSWSAGGGRGTSGPSCAQPGQATPTHSALLPPSRLLRAWASFCLCARELRVRETGVGGGGRARTLSRETASLPASARLTPGLRFSVLSRRVTRVLSVPPCLPSRGRACPLCAWQLRPQLSCVPDSHASHPVPRLPISWSARLGDPESLGSWPHSWPPTPHTRERKGCRSAWLAGRALLSLRQDPCGSCVRREGEPLMDRMFL